MDSEARQTRLRRREQEPEEEEELPPLEEDLGADDADADGDDGEVTRCLCRKQEYPGVPIPVNDSSRNYSPKETSPSDGLDVGGDMFIQCDGCKVWQHGGCVGIMNESMSPEEYYCEECRKDLHKVMTGARGQRYSRYLPVYEAFNNTKPSRRSPASKDKDTESRASKDPETKGMSAAAISSAKKRSTMNSRAALDEEEMLRKAIEESKAEGTLSTAGSSIRKGGKRGREESEDTKQDLKRRKTASDPDSLPDADANGDAESDEDAQTGRSKTGNGTRRPRVAPVQTQKEKDKELKDLKEKERERVEAAGRRKGRAERRNIEEREAAEEAAAVKTTPTTATKAAAIPKLARQATTPKIPQSTPPVSTASPSHKKNARAAPKRGRVGRNQYTRDRDEAEDGAEAARPQTRDSDKGAQADENANTTQQSRASKTKPLNPNRTSMNELKKRVAGMMDFITRTQVELAGEKTPPNGIPQQNGAPAPPQSNGTMHGPNGVPPSTAAALSRPSLLRTASIKGAASKLREQIDGHEKEAAIDESAFGTMSSHEMLDVLTRRLVHWQKDHGKYGER